MTKLQLQPLLNEVNCAWALDPESANKQEWREILLNMVAPVSAKEGYNLSSHCNIITAGLHSKGLPLRIDSEKAVRAVYSHVTDRVTGVVPTARPINDPRQPEKVMNALFHVASVQGWNQQLVDNWKNLKCIRLMKARTKMLKKKAVER